MASLKQTKIYGALEVYNGENKVSITVDPENYPNGNMEIGCINIDGIEMRKYGNLLGIGSDISTNNISALSLNTGSITTSSITASSMTFTENTGTISGLKTLNFETGSTGSNGITNIHSIAFDTTSGSSISNLYSLNMNSTGVVKFGSNKIKIGSFSGESLNYFKLLSQGIAGGLFLGQYTGENNESGVKLKWNGSVLDINQPITTKNITIQSDSGYSTTLSANNEDNTLHLNGGITINPSVTGADTNQTIITNSSIETLSLSSQLIKTGTNNISISGTNDIDLALVTYGVAIGDNADITAAGGVAIGAEANAKSGAISIGRRSSATGQNSIAIGSKNNNSTSQYATTADGDGSIAIGARTSINSTVYNGARAYGNASIAIGVDSYTGGDYNTALGFCAKTPSKLVNNTSGGSGASTSQKNLKVSNSIAIGYSASVQHPESASSSSSDISDSIAIGSGANCTASNGIALGHSASCSSAERLVIPTGWTFHSGTGSALTSDRLEKTDIKPLKGEYTNLIMNLEPVTYRFNYREDYIVENPDPKYRSKYGIPEYNKSEHAKATKAHDRTHVGFIAQDVKSAIEKCFPGNDHLDIVSIDKMDTGEFQRGEVDAGYERYYMNYTALIPVLVKSIQEQQAEIEELKAEIAKLKK